MDGLECPNLKFWLQPDASDQAEMRGPDTHKWLFKTIINDFMQDNTLIIASSLLE